MNRLIGFVASFVFTFGSFSFATGVDPADSVLIAYHLTPAQSAQFSTADTAVSAFWDSIAVADHDYWKLLPSTHAYLQNGATGFTNDSDAQMTIKAAYDSAGVYFYFKVLDNCWMKDTGWQPDVVDLYIDNHSSSDINSADQTAEYCQGHLTYTSQQHWISIGGDSTPAAIGLNYYDSSMGAFTNTTLDMTTASQKIEVVKIDSLTRVLEMFIPWANLGGGGVAGMAAQGTQYAISGGYNDLDSGLTAANCLRILHKGDPYLTDQNYWADLELGPRIDEPPVKIKNAARLHGSMLSSGKIARTEYFTIAGKKIDKPALTIRRFQVLIRQDKLDNGKILHSVIRN